MTKSLLMAVIVGLSAGMMSCVTRQDIRGIQTDLYNIQKNLDSKLGSVEDQTSTVQVTQADLRQDMQELSMNIAVLNAELKESQSRASQLATRLDDLDASLVSRMDAQIELLSGSKFTDKPLPSTVYNLANTDYVRGNYTDAIKGFDKYIKEFPKGERVPEAMLKIGESYEKKKSFTAAASAYEGLIKEYPDNKLAPTALLKQASAYGKLGQRSKAKDNYLLIIKKFPTRSEAETAKQTLQTWEANSKNE